MMSDRTVAGLRPGSVLLDANLLLLLVVGLADPSSIGRSKRLDHFSVADFRVLTQFLNTASEIVTTAHVLTEVSNLAAQGHVSLQQSTRSHLQNLVLIWQEVTPVARDLVPSPLFHRFGLTDAALATLCKDSLLVTEDRRLAGYLRNAGLPVWTLEDVRNWAVQGNRRHVQ